MSDLTQQPSAWRHLIDEWTQRELQLRPHLPVVASTVRVRDAVEVGDHAYVLLSYDVESPWPAEEDVVDADATEHTAIIQAERLRQPWYERDSTRARTVWRSVEAGVVVHEYVLGDHRAFSGQMAGEGNRVVLEFSEGNPVEATIVNGWFLAVNDSGKKLISISVDGAEKSRLEVAEIASMLPDPSFARSGADAMYFSPLDLRTVHSIVQWQRAGNIVAVVTCIEQYDEGGIVRLRIDGIRVDDDVFVAWPRVSLMAGEQEIPSALCGEYALADTISLDIGFRPWFAAGVDKLKIRIDGIRGAAGEVAPIELVVSLSSS